MLQYSLAKKLPLILQMPESAGLTRFYVAIDYRTQRGLGFWSDIISAVSSDEAREMAEKLLHGRRKTAVRIDRIVVM
jgi:hypothetical protein